MFRKDAGYEYSSSRLFLAKNNGDGSVTYIKGTKAGWDRDNYLEIENLEEGDYYFVAEVDWNEKTEDKSFVVNCYGPSEIDFAECDEDKNEIIRMVAADHVTSQIGEVEVTPNEEDAAIVKSKVTSDFGYEMIHIQNGADESGYKETVNFPKFEGLTLMEPESGNGYDVLVAAGETKIVLIKQSCRGYGYSMSFSS